MFHAGTSERPTGGPEHLSRPAERVTVLANYVEQSMKRARKVDELITRENLARPPAMAIMEEDLGRALEKLSRVGPLLNATS